MADARRHRKELTIIRDSELTDQTELGTGGFGMVYRARHRTLGLVALKKLLTTHVDETYVMHLNILFSVHGVCVCMCVCV